MSDNNKLIFMSLAALVGVYLISYVSNYEEDIIHKEIGEIIGNFDPSVVQFQSITVLKNVDHENGWNLDITNKYFTKGLQKLKNKTKYYYIVLHLTINPYSNRLVIENYEGIITIRFD
jgi:hypothetical protein